MEYFESIYTRNHDRLLMTLYGRLQDSDGWQGILEIIQDYLEGNGGFIGLIDKTSSTVTRIFAATPEPADWLNWELSESLVSGLCSGKVISTFIGGPFPTGLEHLLATGFAGDERRSVILALVRRTSFPADAVARLKALLPHLSNLFNIHVRVTGLSVRLSDTRNVIEMFDSAILLLRRSGEIVLTNRAAERLLAAGDGLAVNRGRLTAALAQDTSALQTAMAGVKPDSPARPLLLNRPGNDEKILFHVIPLPPPVDSPGIIGAEIAVVLTAARGHGAPPAAALQALGFTPAETRLATALASNGRLDEIAEEQGVSKGTLRTHLLGIFRKTGTARQADLVSFLQGLATVSLKLTRHFD